MLNAPPKTLSLGIPLHNPLSRSWERVEVRVHEDRKHEYGVVKRFSITGKYRRNRNGTRCLFS